MDQEWKAADKSKPSHGSGYYAVYVCIDPKQEGFVYPEYWDGQFWNFSGVGAFIDVRLVKIGEAENVAVAANT